MVSKKITLLSIVPLLMSSNFVKNDVSLDIGSYVTDTYPVFSDFEKIAESSGMHTVISCPEGYVTEYCEVSKHSYTENSDLYLYKTTTHFYSGHYAKRKGFVRPNGEQYTDSYLYLGIVDVAPYQYKGLEYGGEINVREMYPTSTHCYTTVHPNGDMETTGDTKIGVGANFWYDTKTHIDEAQWLFEWNEGYNKGELIDDYELNTYVLFEMTNSVSYFNRDAFRSYIKYSFIGMYYVDHLFSKKLEKGSRYEAVSGRDYFV